MEKLTAIIATLITFMTLNAQTAEKIAENLKTDIGLFKTEEVVQCNDSLFIANLKAENLTMENGLDRINETLGGYTDILVSEPWSISYDYELPAMTITLFGESGRYMYVIGIALTEADGLWMSMLVARNDKQSLGIEE